MSSAAVNPTTRTTRSVSKARSQGSADAQSIGAPSVGAPSIGGRSTGTRATRGRGSRSGATPAAAATAPEADHDELPSVKKAYGTSGRSADLQPESARIHKRPALGPILEAVSGAENSNNNKNDADALPVVDEGDEGGPSDVRGSNQNIFPDFIQTPRTNIFSRFSYRSWCPRRIVQSYANEGEWVAQQQQILIEENRNKKIMARVATILLYALLVLSFGFVGYKIPNIIGYVSDINTFLPATTGNHALGNVTAHDYKLLKHRLDLVEQHLHNLPTSSTTSNPTVEHQINWFTPGFGAIVDVELSSPTTTFCDPTWKPWPFGNMLGQSCPQLPISPPHKMALQHWDDPVQDRWCAPRSGGKLQLAIEVMRPILPTQLVVEYMAKQTSPTGFMESAPKEIELWIRVDDDDVRAKISRAIFEWHPELWEESSPQQRELHLKRDLGEKYVPVGRWIYNIYDQANVQGFTIPTPLLEFGVHSTKFAIRVNSNWGNVDFTCINRFRMHGVDASGIEEDLEEDPKVVRG